MARIILNGKNEIVAAQNLIELVCGRGLTPEAVVIELNGAIVKRDQWDTVAMRDGDKVELIGFVGGG